MKRETNFTKSSLYFTIKYYGHRVLKRDTIFRKLCPYGKLVGDSQHIISLLLHG